LPPIAELRSVKKAVIERSPSFTIHRSLAEKAQRKWATSKQRASSIASTCRGRTSAEVDRLSLRTERTRCCVKLWQKNHRARSQRAREHLRSIFGSEDDELDDSGRELVGLEGVQPRIEGAHQSERKGVP
jgi:hypothetical protein